MRVPARHAALAWTVAAAASCKGPATLQTGAPVAATGADVIFENGNIYTNGAESPRAQAIAVKDGRIIYVGSTGGGEAFVKGGARVVDLGGRTVVPGFTDAHVHLSGIGAREATLNLEGIVS